MCLRMINEPCFRRFILGRSPMKSNALCEVRLRLTVADIYYVDGFVHQL